MRYPSLCNSLVPDTVLTINEGDLTECEEAGGALNTTIMIMITILWAVLMAWRFFRDGPERAAMITLISGWVVLPVAFFDPVYMAETNQLEIPVALPGVVLPASFWWTKATLLGTVLTISTAVFGRRALRGYRWSWWDLPIVVWCCAPLIHFLVVPQAPPGRALSQTVYLWLSWGVVYAAGRLWLGNARRLVEWYRLWVLATLMLLPFCLLEFLIGPYLYEWLYGFHPYQWCGALRYVGFRPMLLFEHGNQLGIWLAGGALLAIGMWRCDTTGRVGPIPLWWAVILLTGATLMAQSLGAIVLLPLAVGMLWIADSRRYGRLALVCAAGLLMAYIAMRALGLVRFELLVDSWPVASEIQSFFESIGRRSFGYRLIREEEHASRMMNHWGFGGGVWDWWRADGGSARPWALWPMAMGMFGLVGLIPMLLIFVGPIAVTCRRILYADQPTASPATRAVVLLGCAFVALHFLDSFLNSAVVLPIVATAGGLVTVVQQHARPPGTMKAPRPEGYTDPRGPNHAK